MTSLITLFWFIIILGAIVGIHEFGHFLFAKLSNTYVYEFSIGMGKKLFTHRKKDSETEFNIRLVPIGGFVSICGENAIEDENIPKDRQLCNKSFLQRFSILFAGPAFNFIFAFILLFISALIYGSISTKPVIGSVMEGYPAYTAGLREGDLIKKIDGKKVNSWDAALLKIQTANGKELTFTIEENGQTKDIKVSPIVEEAEDGTKSYKYGISTNGTKERGFVKSLNYAISKTESLFGTMIETLKYLFTGRAKVNDLSGPVGIYSLVGQQAKAGLESIIYLTAYLSINVGALNLIPFPAFDGGRILFLIIEKITKKKIPPKVENMVNTIGFLAIIGLMIFVTFNDILRLFS